MFLEKMMTARTTSIRFGGKAAIGNEGGGRAVLLPCFTLVGRSRAGEGTCFAIPELRWMFDCGALVSKWTPKRIFLSHTHFDHVQYLTHMRSKNNPPKVVLPVGAAPFVKAHLKAYQEMIDCCPTEGESANAVRDILLFPTGPDEEFVFPQGGDEYICRTVACHHRIECLGFSIFRRKKTLKKEFVGLPGLEIGRLRKEGVEITTSDEEPFVCFLGDTTKKVFERYPLLLKQHKIVIVECSFIDDKSEQRAKETKHLHWDDLKPYVEDNPQILFVLIHFSLKYKSLELRRFFVDQSRHKNIHPMLIESEIEDEWKKAGIDGTIMPRCNCFVCTSGE